MKKTTKLRMAELTSQIVGKPYKLGEWDCLGVVLFFCDNWGISIPENFEGYTKENYIQLFIDNPKRAKEIFFRFIASLGKEVDPKRTMPGDFLIIETNGETGVCINVGGGNILSALLEKGIDVVSMKTYTVLKAYRWRKD